MNAVDLALFSHLVKRPEAELDLSRAALLIAHIGDETIDIPHYVDVLDKFGQTARERLASVGARPGSKGAIEAVLRYLYAELGFRGNSNDYYDSRNSFLSDVLDRRTGIPISLAVVLVEVLGRAGIVACGISFPGHFLVRATADAGNVYLDPFSGQILGATELDALYQRMTGSARPIDPRALEPATRSATLIRMLNNLRGIYAHREDRERLREILQCMNVLAPSRELQTELGRLDVRPGGGAN